MKEGIRQTGGRPWWEWEANASLAFNRSGCTGVHTHTQGNGHRKHERRGGFNRRGGCAICSSKHTHKSTMPWAWPCCGEDEPQRCVSVSVGVDVDGGVVSGVYRAVTFAYLSQCLPPPSYSSTLNSFALRPAAVRLLNRVDWIIHVCQSTDLCAHIDPNPCS